MVRRLPRGKHMWRVHPRFGEREHLIKRIDNYPLSFNRALIEYAARESQATGIKISPAVVLVTLALLAEPELLELMLQHQGRSQH